MLIEKIKKLSKNYQLNVIEIRRHIHQYPELSFQEFETSKYIQKQLSLKGISFKTGYVNTGIVAIIKGKNPEKKTILIRADMDALPIQEENETDYKSIHKGIMHACGHDVHSAIALGAAFILNDLKDCFEGTIKIMFQPGEEILPGGANLMIKEGVLENPKVDKAIALHVFPSLETGNIGFKSGMYMASSDELYITVIGKEGHAALPNDYINPILIASEILLEINNKFMMPNSFDGLSEKDIPTVIAFGKIIGNGSTNIIPEKVEISGTLRTMNEAWREKIHLQLHQLVNSIALKYKSKSFLKIVNGYPFLINDEVFTNNCFIAAKEFLGSEHVQELPLRMTAEDFAFISQKVPSCFFRLGTGNTINKITAGVHTSKFNIDERALEIGTGIMAWLAIKELNN